MGWVALLALVAAIAMLATASAQAATPSIYFASTPEYTVILKAEGRSVYATYLKATEFCVFGGGSRESRTESSFESFEQEPRRLVQKGSRFGLVEADRSAFESANFELHGVRSADVFVGTFSRSNFDEGSEEGGGCQTNDYTGDSSVPFEAMRYVPSDSPVASTLDAAAPAIYFEGGGPLEIYFRTEGESLLQVLGNASQTCRGAAVASKPRREFLFEFGVSTRMLGEDRFELSSHSRDRYLVESRLLSGTITPEAVFGHYHRRAIEKERGHVDGRCRTGTRRGHFDVRYRALRYVPAIGAQP